MRTAPIWTLAVPAYYKHRRYTYFVVARAPRPAVTRIIISFVWAVGHLQERALTPLRARYRSLLNPALYIGLVTRLLLLKFSTIPHRSGVCVVPRGLLQHRESHAAKRASGKPASA